MSKIKWEVPRLTVLSNRVDGRVVDCTGGSTADGTCTNGPVAI